MDTTAEPMERTCMICGRSELDHPARGWRNACLVAFEASRSTYAQGEQRASLGLWPAAAWEAFQRLHALTAATFRDAPEPDVAEWVDRLQAERSRQGRGSLYQLPVPLF